ncbi:MAG: GTPase RsgA, partial [Myxococcota bacterium]
MSEAQRGVVVATAGRRVIVRDHPDDGVAERACFRAGQRAVVGDRVQWVEARGEGGKLTEVEDRGNALIRTDDRGREQVLAANLAGVLVVCAAVEPPFRAGLLDRYLVAASVSEIDAHVVVNKLDQGVPAEVDAELAVRAATGVDVVRVSATTGEG